MGSTSRGRFVAVGVGAAIAALLPAVAMAQTGGTGAQTLIAAPPVFANVAQTNVSRPPGRVRATLQAMRIEQRISAAAVRRANAIQQWLDEGLQTRDLAGGGITTRELAGGIVTALAPSHPVTVPTPRPVVLAKAGPESPLRFTRTQMLINQRISQAAVLRSNALTARLSALTGGDIRAGEVTLPQLQNVLFTLGRQPSVATPPASTTSVRPLSRPAVSSLALTDSQMLINQRVAQAAVRRTNALIVKVGRGLAGDSFQPGSIGTDRLAPALRG